MAGLLNSGSDLLHVNNQVSSYTEIRSPLESLRPLFNSHTVKSQFFWRLKQSDKQVECLMITDTLAHNRCQIILVLQSSIKYC